MASNAEIVTYVLKEHGVDISEIMKWEHVKVDRAKCFLAITCAELAKMILDATAAGDEQAARLAVNAPRGWQHDPDYATSKASALRALSTEIRVAHHALRIAVQGLKAGI
jgi:hypothetical protein